MRIKEKSQKKRYITSIKLFRTITLKTNTCDFILRERAANQKKRVTHESKRTNVASQKLLLRRSDSRNASRSVEYSIATHTHCVHADVKSCNVLHQTRASLASKEHYTSIFALNSVAKATQSSIENKKAPHYLLMSSARIKNNVKASTQVTGMSFVTMLRIER